MGNQPTNNQQMTITDGQPQGQFKPYTTEEKKEYAKQFTAREKASYRKGQANAYGHIANIGRRNSSYISNNLKNDGAATPPPAPSANKPQSHKPQSNKPQSNK